MQQGLPLGMRYHSASASTSAWESYWFDRNLQGDIIAVYNEAGTLLMSYNYDAWGSCAYTSHNGGSSTAAYYNPFRYRGYYYDSDLTMYYLNSRYYDQITGRFISPDDVGYLGANGDLNSYNLYAYCSNNPVMYTDPSGHLIIAAIIIGIAGGVAVGGTVGGVISYNSAKSTGTEGSDLFWETMKGIGTGSVVGGSAGVLIGATGGVVAAYGAGSIAGTALITGTATIAARATEVGALQYKKNNAEGKNGWQIANDILSSTYTNPGKILFPAVTKSATTSVMYVFTDIAKHKVIPLSFQTYLQSSAGRAIPYGFAAYAWVNTTYSIVCNDPIARAHQRGYTLR